MRIYSKFRDYYDIGLSHGIDDSIHFNRQTTEVQYNVSQLDILLKTNYFTDATIHRISNIERVDYSHLVDSISRFNDLNISRYTVLFCGKQYNLIQLYIQGYKKHYLKLCNDVGQLTQQLSELQQTRLVNEIYDTTRCDYNSALFTSTGKKLVNWFNSLMLTQQNIDDMHKHFNSAIILIKPPHTYGAQWTVTTNCNLGNLGFVQIVDPFSAFQQISMYLSNQLASESKPPVELTDVDKVNKHGFDKQSFRMRK
jgi:hypothetical protein